MEEVVLKAENSPREDSIGYMVNLLGKAVDAAT